MANRNWTDLATAGLRLIVACAAYAAIFSGLSACGDDDLTVPGAPPPTVPRPTETPDDDDS